MTDTDPDFANLKALFINTTLTRSPGNSHTQLLVDVSASIMAKQGVAVDQFRAVDHPIATGIHPNMREHGWSDDAWPDLFKRVQAADILVIAGPIWLGDNSSETKKIIERLYAHSSELNDKGQWLYFGKVGGCLITGNEDGIKHCASNVLYSLQHIGYSVAPQSDAGWIGEAGPGPSYADAEFSRRVPGTWQPTKRMGSRSALRFPEPRIQVVRSHVACCFHRLQFGDRRTMAQSTPASTD
jgi:multimeric flavodoxin WrbA